MSEKLNHIDSEPDEKDRPVVDESNRLKADNLSPKPPVITLQEPQEDLARSSTARPVWLLRRPCPILSPVSEIAFNFGKSSIATPKTTKHREGE
jgi:hypothetical protein